MPSLAVSTVSLVAITEVLSDLECLLGFLEERSFSFYPEEFDARVKSITENQRGQTFEDEQIGRAHV